MKRCVIDTNVMVTANKAVKSNDDELLKYPHLIIKCINVLQWISKKGVYVVLDVDNEIFDEYKRHLSFSGQPGVGDKFFKWLHDNRYRYPDTEVKLHKMNGGYKEFPQKMEAVSVDISDKKFFAVSNAHRSKPSIFEAVDTRWWNWADAAKQCGIDIIFLDELYMIEHNSNMEK